MGDVILVKTCNRAWVATTFQTVTWSFNFQPIGEQHFCNNAQWVMYCYYFQRWDGDHMLENLSGFETKCSMIYLKTWSWPYATVEAGKTNILFLFVLNSYTYLVKSALYMTYQYKQTSKEDEYMYTSKSILVFLQSFSPLIITDNHWQWCMSCYCVAEKNT